MSRNVKTTGSDRDEREISFRDTKSGKILFTEYHGKMCALLLRENRLLAAQVMSDAPNRLGAVYIGKVKNVVQNIDAIFLEIAGGEICFLSKKDAVSPVLLNRNYDGRILEGDEILVQLSSEAQKTKQASVTTNLSLSDEYAAISLNRPGIAYSGKIGKSRRTQIGEWFQEESFTLPSDMGLMVRTRADDCSRATLFQSIQTLLNSFRNMMETARHRTCFSCIRQAPDAFEAMLDQLTYPYEYEEIVTDNAVLYGKLCVFCQDRLPDKTVRLYEDQTLSLSKLYSLEQKLSTALDKRVWLKSGGYLVIEPTEALTVIDVNTGKYEVKKASWDAYEKINREAAEEIALQLRLRNLSGMILVDFINMKSKESEDSLVKFMRELVRRDKLRTTVVDITPLGLVEITRKKQNRPLREQLL